MRVLFERSGGFAGITIRKEFDAAHMTKAQSRQLQEHVHRAGFFELPQRIQASTTSPDRFHYRLTIESGSRTHTVDLDEAAVPSVLRPLLDFLSGR